MTIQEIKFDKDKFYFFVFQEGDLDKDDILSLMKTLEVEYPYDSSFKRVFFNKSIR
jgi:hypothetical protein